MYILKYNNNGTADLLVNLKLSKNGYNIARKGGHVSAGCVFIADNSGTFRFTECSITKEPRKKKADIIGKS